MAKVPDFEPIHEAKPRQSAEETHEFAMHAVREIEVRFGLPREVDSKN